MLRKQPQRKKGEMAKFNFNLYFKICLLAIIGNETNLKTQTSKFHAETPEHGRSPPGFRIRSVPHNRKTWNICLSSHKFETKSSPKRPRIFS